MSSFKEAIEADILSIFLNSDEFAEDSGAWLVNDRSMNIVIDNLELAERSKGDLTLDATQRIYTKQMLIYVASSEYGDEPKIGSLLKLQKVGKSPKEYTVTNCINEDGIYSISLEAYR